MIENTANIPVEFLEPYKPSVYEPEMRALWEKADYANPDTCAKLGFVNESLPPFSIVLPPPNVTGTLHTGHALMCSIEDVMVRHARMRGHRTLWLPGTDHAAIATQSKVEKLLEKEGIKKRDLSREDFLDRVNAFAQASHDTIVSQIKAIGSSVDWSREAYTLDDKRNFAVRTAFKRMYDDGLIYRGYRCVNWDPKGQTNISDDEIVYVEEKTKFYYLKYGPFTIGTARPETKFSDKYVVMHPEDTRYSEYQHMQKITVEWINGPITATIIKDEVVDPAFGTGVMTITPWHSSVDFELAQKYNLESEQIIDLYGKLLPVAGEFSGMKIAEAREKIIEKLASKGLVEKIEDYVHNIPTAERTGCIIEPQIRNQWFIDVRKEFTIKDSKIDSIPSGSITCLRDLTMAVAQTGQIDFLPKRFTEVYLKWIENLRPWCISRQIWFGHRIPVWFRGDEVYCDTEAPTGEGWEQDPDTLDTWFSSGLWTFSTMGWPNTESGDFKMFHPTTIVETGHDIIFFWVARMILMSTYLLGEIPFKTAYFHGMVLTPDGKKMSKSSGNAAKDPIDIINESGADALRMALVVANGPGQSIKLGDEKIKAYSKFSNKLWNITRFVLESTNKESLGATSNLTKEDTKTWQEYKTTMQTISSEMENYQHHLASEKLYHYIWHTFADITIENVKNRIANKSEDMESGRTLLQNILLTNLKMLHPYMPHCTEKIWQLLPKQWKNNTPSLMICTWPM